MARSYKTLSHRRDSLISITSMVFCLQAIAILSQLDREFSASHAGGFFGWILWGLAATGFVVFAVTTLTQPQGFGLAMLAYLAGGLLLFSGVPERQAHTVYRISCNVGQNAAGCEAASKSAYGFGWLHSAKVYQRRANNLREELTE